MINFASKEEEKSLKWRDLMIEISKLNQFDYSKSVYISSKTPVIITCKLHGDFTVTPNDHLNKRAGCPKCHNKIISLKKSMFDKLFFERANKKYNFRFDYSESIYTGYQNSLTIICPIHGKFETTPYKHLNYRAGCLQCGKEMNKGGYCLTSAKRNIRKYKAISATIYYMRCSNKKESFFKVGVTTNSIQTRVNVIPYNCKIIKESKDNLYNAIITEYEITEKLKKFQYQPLIKFAGHTECFSTLDIN